MVRAIRKVERIVREELDRAGAQEILMPFVQPASLWEKSGRWSYYGPELLRVKDRKGNPYCLGPTHEEVVTNIVADEVKSYKQLPLNLYQIQTKFRDEIRPRYGLMRGREFIMKDGYSFDVDEEASKKSYWLMYETYNRIFNRCGLKFRPVEADTGNIGGSLSHEFQVLAESGEDTIASCDNCGYAPNVEKAETRPASYDEPSESEFLPLEDVSTPAQKSIEEVSSFLGVAPRKLIKTLIYFDDKEKFYAVAIRGDLEVNELKLKNHVGALEIYPAEERDIEKVAKVPVGFIGPINLEIPIIADNSVKGILNGVTGANKKDFHVKNVNPKRDIKADSWADLALAKAGDRCPRCDEGVLRIDRGIEVGQVFFLGTKYSVPMGATYLAEDGKEHPCVMGCYGIGITRTVAAAIEQNSDADGIIWPMPLAPFQVIITPVLYSGAMKETAEKLYKLFAEAGVETILDDRDERGGVKFKDADLLGFPLRVTVGDKGLARGIVEIRDRRAKKVLETPIEGALETVKKLISEQMAAAKA